MLNLKSLEEKLDKALEAETPESLKKWLFEKRKKSFLMQFGAGQIESKNVVVDSFNVYNKPPLIKETQENVNILTNNTYYAMAA